MRWGSRGATSSERPWVRPRRWVTRPRARAAWRIWSCTALSPGARRSHLRLPGPRCSMRCPDTGVSDHGCSPTSLCPEPRTPSARSSQLSNDCRPRLSWPAIQLAAAYRLDSCVALDELRVPTTVLHRRDDRAIPFALGVDVAKRVPHASFVALEGEDHFPWLGDASGVVDATLRGLGHHVPTRPPAPGPQALTERE